MKRLSTIWALTLDFKKVEQLELKKILFSHGLSVNEFFTFISYKVINCDKVMLELINEFKEKKKISLLEGDLKTRNITDENLYDLIEKDLKKN